MNNMATTRSSKTNDKSAPPPKSDAIEKAGKGALRELSHDAVPVALASDSIDGMMQIMKDNLGPSGQLNITDLSRITIPAGGGTAWEIPNPIAGNKPKSTQALDVVIVDFKDQKAFWKESLDDTGGGTPPDCRSMDMVHGIGEPGGFCNGGVDSQPEPCPFNIFGSANEGEGEGKACKDLRFLFILEGRSRLPKLLVVPPTSLKAMKKYFISLAEGELRFNQVVTRLELEVDKNAKNVKYSKIVPSAIAELSDEEKATADLFKGALAPMIGNLVVQNAAQVKTE